MTGPKLLVQDNEHPERILVPPNVILLSEDLGSDTPLWSRYTQGPYAARHGFLMMSGVERVKIAAFFREDENTPYERVSDEDYLASELNRYLIEGTSTAIHYFPGLCVHSLLVGLPIDTELTMPERYRSPTCLYQNQIQHNI